ncbi:SIR2 family NAD-dependent protein deacylase [Rhodohalobacter sp. 8-1]|uniref:SIR2 family NAD-dependent protein deacylase n=1 Tax=Rhodohalobacter sp. 8-1 TaxID=3131972 RepID=UPI0030EEB07E
MSADSGLSTFRDSGGLWEGHDIEDVATVRGWKKDPERVLDFYNKRRKQSGEATPNKGHKALAELEDYFDVSIITQNVDDLHERAGSSQVLHLHGKLSEARSSRDPDQVIDIGSDPIDVGDKAEDGSQLRPNVVWFGEAVPNIEPASAMVSQADLMAVIGTSLVVYPAAGLIDFAKPEIPKFIVDPSQPQIQLGDKWTYIPKPAKTGVPELKKILISKFSKDD